MAPKKIYALVTNDLNYDQRMHRICDSLQKEGYDVTLVGRELQISEVLKTRDFKQHRLQCFFNSGVLFYLEFNIRLILFLLAQKVDIIHAVDLDTLGAGTVIKLLKRCRLVFDAHEYFTEVPELKGKLVKKRIWSMLGKLCSSSIDVAITVSPPLQQILSEKYDIEFHLLRNFPGKSEIEISDESIEKRENVLLYQGAVNEGRGIEESIKLMKKIENYQLWIIGEGDILDKCKEVVSKNKLTEKVKFFGYLSPDELKKYTSKAKIGLNLLKGDSENYRYSLANKFFDYIQAYVPCITMKFETYTSILEKHRVGVAVNDLRTDTLMAAIREIESEYDSYVRDCKTASGEFIWVKEERKLIRLYRDVVNPG